MLASWLQRWLHFDLDTGALLEIILTARLSSNSHTIVDSNDASTAVDLTILARKLVIETGCWIWICLTRA